MAMFHQGELFQLCVGILAVASRNWRKQNGGLPCTTSEHTNGALTGPLEALEAAAAPNKTILYRSIQAKRVLFLHSAPSK